MTTVAAPPTLRDRILDALERGASSAAEQFLAAIVAFTGARSLASLPWAFALSSAAGAFVVSVLLTAVAYGVGANALSFRVDLIVRVVKSFAASLLASLGSGVIDVRSVPWAAALNIAALAAILTLVKGLLSPNAHLSASLLPTPVVARLSGVSVESGAFKRT